MGELRAGGGPGERPGAPARGPFATAAGGGADLGHPARFSLGQGRGPFPTVPHSYRPNPLGSGRNAGAAVREGA